MSARTEFVPVERSLADLLGEAYVEAVCTARAALTGKPIADSQRLARARVAFLPKTFLDHQHALLRRVGERVVPAFTGSADGATTRAYQAATSTAAAPLSAGGWFRLAEDGTLRLALKSEHYHASLGHDFPGFELLALAHRLGIPNATHNNTRGHITRLLEESLVRVANGLPTGDSEALRAVLTSDDPKALNRVLNLQTGSLACEAALKLALARFYRSLPDQPEPPLAGKTPVFLVVGDRDGGPTGNYHGTTLVAQMLRGMWPEMFARCGGAFRVRPILPNDLADLEQAFREASDGDCRPAAFIHELILMNYGGTRLTPAFIRRAYELAAETGTPTFDDEIQSCLWSPEILLFREYGIQPDGVILGKGMSGGEYAGSRLIFAQHLDRLPQFGALVTNGQEELTSLAYLICLAWAEANAEAVGAIGDYYEAGLRRLTEKYAPIRAIEGQRHLAALVFDDLDLAKQFAEVVGKGGLDISVQSYKSNCPPAALTKPPITATIQTIDLILARLDEAMSRFA